MSAPKKEYLAKVKKLIGMGGDAETRMAALGEAIDIADSHQDVFMAMSLRMRLLQVAVFSGRHDEVLIHFAWCINQCERDPALFDAFESEILWRFKWVLAEVPKYASISRAQIEQVFQQMVFYYDKAGAGHRAIYCLRAQSAIYLGDWEQIPLHRDAWIASPKDGQEDCPACETNTLIDLFLTANQPERAIDAAEALIAGRQTCAEQPDLADSHLLVPLFRLKRYELAQRLERRSFEKIRANRDYFGSMGSYLAFFAASDQLVRGMEMWEALARELPYVTLGHDRLMGLKGAAVFLRRMRDAGHAGFKARVPAGVAFHRTDGQYEVKPVLDWVQEEARRLAEEFDHRNGNGRVGSGLHEYDNLLESVHPLLGSE